MKIGAHSSCVQAQVSKNGSSN